MFSGRSSEASGSSTASRASGSSRAPSRASGSGGSSRENSKTHGHFKYIVDWGDVPLAVKRALTAAEDKHECVHPDITKRLLRWISADLMTKYTEFRQSHIVRKKTPGMEVYRDITTQIITDKYLTCLRIEADGVLLDHDGYDTFLDRLSHMMEHKGRKQPNVPKQPLNAAVSKGTVVASHKMYNPEISVEERGAQSTMKERLQEIFHTYRENQWPMSEIDELMNSSYPLQRMDIVAFGIIFNEEPDEDQETDDTAREAPSLCIAKIRTDWPFLFEPRWQNFHYLTLTDNPIDDALQGFIDQQLNMLINFLTSSTSDTGMRCLAVKCKWEQDGSRPQTKFMMAMKMVSLYFQEDSKTFFIPAERTTPPSEVKLLQGITGFPTIVALHQNIFMASKFYVCIDQQVIREAYTSEEAVLGIIHGAFIFSVDYPNCLKHTFEYIERVVCQLGSSSQSKQPLRVMTLLVLRLVNAVKKFQERFNTLSNEA